MLLAATTINYIDRQVLGVLAPFLQDEIGWSEIEYGYIVTAFQAAYAIGLLCAGAIIDRLGTRIGYAIAIVVWSIAAMSHALAATVVGFMIARFFLGLGEAGNFPAAIKTVAEWFPRRERAFATGIFNSGSNIGAIVAPLMVPLIAVSLGWQAAFLFTGMLSAIWLAVWLLWYRAPEQQPKLTSAELAHIRSDPPEVAAKVPWARILKHRQAWAFVAAKFMTDPIWWFFLFWLPKFLHSEYGLTLLGLGLPLVVIFVMADVGSIFGGWIAGRSIRLGWSVNRARKGAMLICALCVVRSYSLRGPKMWFAYASSALPAGHQSVANVFTLTSDSFPRTRLDRWWHRRFAALWRQMMPQHRFAATTGSYVRSSMPSAYMLALLVEPLAPRLEPRDGCGSDSSLSHRQRTRMT